MPQRKKEKQAEKRVVAGKFTEVTPEEQKQIIAKWDMEEAEKRILSQKLYQRITKRMTELVEVKDEDGEPIAYLRRLTDGEFNDIIGRHAETLSRSQKAPDEMTQEERQGAEDFMTDLIAASIFIPEELKSRKEVSKLDKGIRLRLQTAVSAINGLGVSQKNLESLLGQS